MSPPLNLGRRAVEGAAWITLDTMGMQALSLVVFAILARLLTPHDFGLASIAYVLVNSCKIVLFDGLATAIARKAEGSAVEYSTAFWLTVAIAAISVATLQALSFKIDALFGIAGLASMLRIMSLMLLAQGIARTQEVWLSRHFMYRTLAVRSLFGAVLGGAVGVGLAVEGYGAWALALQQVLTSVFAFALLWFTCPWRPARVFSRSAASEILRFCLGTSGSSLIYALNNSFDTMLIGAFFGPASAGLYNVAKRLRMALQMVAAAPVNGIALPALAEVQGDQPRFVKVLLTAITIVLAVCGPLFLGAAVISHDIIVLVFGPQWSTAAPLFQWLAVGGLCTILMDYNTNVFLIRGRPRWTLYLAVLNIVLTLGIFFVIKTYHIESVAAPFVLPYIVIIPISVAAFIRASGITFRRWAYAVARPLIASIIMVVTSVLLQPFLHELPLVSRLLIMISGSVILYGAVGAFVLHEPLFEIIRLTRRKQRVSVSADRAT